MSVLSDHSLRIRLATRTRERLVITPLADDAVQPASVDVRLGSELLMRERGQVVDPMAGVGPRWLPMSQYSNGWLLFPDNLYLGTTLEYIEVPDDLLCHVHGRSSLGREGIVIHQTAGLVDPGYRGHLTLEITVTHATILRAGMPIGQLTFQRLTTPAEQPYGSNGLGSHYQGDTEPTPSRLSLPRSASQSAETQKSVSVGHPGRFRARIGACGANSMSTRKPVERVVSCSSACAACDLELRDGEISCYLCARAVALGEAAGDER